MKKTLMAVLIPLIFLSSCNNNNINSSNDISSNNSYPSANVESSSSDAFKDDTNYHVGGDETSDARFDFRNDGTFNYGSLTIGNKNVEYVLDPQLLPTFFLTTTFIYNVDLDTFSQNSASKKGVNWILYTPDFYFSYTNANNQYYQLVATYNESIDNYVVESIIDSGAAYIPLNGVVLTIPKSMDNPFDIGDSLNLNNTINRYSYALVNQDDVRMCFSSYNSYRNEKEVVLFDQSYGVVTKTNSNGSEMTVQYDFDRHDYVVKGFRGNGVSIGNLENDHLSYGSKIPQYGFVISAHNKAHNYELYKQGRKFDLNDTLYFENFDLTNSLSNAKLKKHYFDNPSSRMDNTITYFDWNGNRLDEYGYTKFNLWGAFEIAVTKIDKEYGIITAMDREVGCPLNGYILSSNSSAAVSLKEVCQIGSVVQIKNDDIYIYNDIGRKDLVNLKYYKSILDEKFEDGKNKLFDYDFDTLNAMNDYLNNSINQVSKLYDEMNNSTNNTTRSENAIKIKQISINATNSYYLGYISASESKYVETRAAWLWATKSRTLDDVKKLVQHYANCNINLIYLCVFDGMTTFESKYVPYDYSFSGDFGEYGKNNFLGAFIGEAHKAGIEVHGWTTNFHVGNVGDTNTLFNAHPNWQQVYYDGKVDSNDEMTEETLLYFDQANPEVWQFLVNFYNELLEKNDLDGLHIDYIRYAAGNDVGKPDSVYCKIPEGGKLYAENCLNRTTGYTNYAMEDFKKEYNLSGDVKELVKDVKTYNLWSEYRTNKVTQFVRKLKNEVVDKNETMFSMAIVPEVEFAKDNKMQDWTKWIDEKLVNAINGMYYSADTYRTTIEYNSAKQNFRGKLYEYPGILAASYFDLPAINNIYFYENAARLSTMGASIFDANAIWSPQRIIYSDSNLDLENLLKKGMHRNKAILPHSNLMSVLKAFVDNVKDRCDNVYVPSGNMSATQKNNLIEELSKLDNINPNQLKQQLNAIKQNLSKYSSGEAISRISDYMDLIINICDIRIYQQ